MSAENAGRSTERRSRRQAKRRDEKRRTLLESLESRQLLAGPDLIGIQPNEGDLLTDGETLTFSPNELVFRFDDNTLIDESTLDAIRITRAGEDGVFESALATSDLGTDGLALFEFRARQPGSLGNGITINLASSNRSGSSLPIITVDGESVTIDINTNPTRRTVAGDLISAVNNNAEASALIEAILVSGSSGQPVGVNDINGTSLVLDGANAAQAVTDFGSNGAVRVRLISQQPGVDGRGTIIEVEQRNFGAPANPVIVVSDQTIRVQVNSFPGAPTTAAEFVDRLNSDPQASRLVSASVQEGDASTAIGNLSTGYSPLTLSGVSDVVVQPGFVGLGDSPREVVFRFAEPLPDDQYQIDIIGRGSAALRNLDGEAFQDGEDLTRPFNINLGPQVVAVVPEPMRRESDGSLSIDVGIIEVHFNDDDLNSTLVRDRDFYQLIYTRDTVDNTDDIVVPLVSDPVYNSVTNVVRLNYGQSLARLPNASGEDFGTARLRIGTNETALPPAPQPVNLPTGSDVAGDSFASAFDLNSQWSISTGTTSSAFLNSEIRNETPFGLELPGPDYPGTREIRPEDPSRLTRVEPLDFTRRGADDFDGITQLRYNFVGSWLGDDPNRQGIVDDTTYFNIISEQQQQRVREILSLYSEYLGVSFIEVADQSQGAIVDISVAVGDLYGGDVRATSGQGGTTAVLRGLPNGAQLVVLDFQDFDESDDDQFGEPFFDVTMEAVGQLLGYGNDLSLPQPGVDYEPIFPSYAEIAHGQYLFRPDSTDIDLYRVDLPTRGSITIETIAERLGTPSSLDSHLRLYRETPSGIIEVAGNDDYASNDSLIRLDDLDAGVYFIGVSAQGNDAYDPSIPGTGFGGLTEGNYELRVDFTPAATSTLTDTDGVRFDGDNDGRPGGVFNFWFKPADANSEVLYVDKGNGFLNNPTNPLPSGGSDLAFVDAFRARGSSMGTIGNPYSEIDRALADAGRISRIRQESLLGEFAELNALRISDPQAAASIEDYLSGLDVTIRIVGNGGLDGNIATTADNFSYQIGFDGVGFPLEDGTSIELPADVQMVIDSGAILKFSRARLGVGSVAPTVDISGSNLQVLGTPSLIGSNGLPARDATGAVIPGSVFFTSINDSSVGLGNQVSNANPQPGDWGGIDFFGELDAADELRTNLEAEGIFLNHIQYADVQYGGGAVTVGGQQIVVSPIELSTTRATIVNSHIANSADAAISATPDTFREDRFTDFFAQDGQRFTPDYDRVGPEIHGNTVVDNSINGLFIRIQTRSGEFLRPLTTAARFDDTDITHVLTENLVIEGTPGGNIVQSEAPSTIVVRGQANLGDGAIPAGTYVYRLANVDSTGLESASSADTVPTTLAATGSITLRQLPTALPGSSTVGRRLYRAEVVGGTVGTFRLVASLNATASTFTDRLSDAEFQLRPELQANASPLRARLDASLTIDPSTVLKLDAARIEARFGANLLAEGAPGNPVVFTSLEDQRYGRGSTFDTNNRGDAGELSPGDWGGIYIGQGGFASLDNVVIAGGGGTTRIEGGFASFNALEVHQGDLRLTNSRLEHNADGRGTPNDTRVGRLDNAPGVLVGRAAAPIVINNDFIDNDAAAISIDLNSLNAFQVDDYGRSTGTIDRFGDEESEAEFVANFGPFIQDNTLTRNSINAMQVRGGTLATEGVWDDVDIVHVVTDSISIPNKHIYGGLRLLSDARGSLVVKFQTVDDTDPAGIVVGGNLLTAADQFVDIPDRIGGSLQLLGHPDFPVVLTALNDDLVGAGFDIDGLPQLDTDNTGLVGIDDGDPTTPPTSSLPTGPEVNLGTTIDNDVDDTITGSFGATLGDANEVLASDVTVQDVTTGAQLLNQDYIFQYSTFLTSGGTTVALGNTTITQPATLIGDDLVESRGTYDGPNGVVNWTATSFFFDGVPTLFSTLDLSSTAPLGQIDIVSYLDEDVGFPTDDVLYTVGTPGQPDFRLFTVDGPSRVGFSHGGFYFNDGVNQNNAIYQGWAADQFNDLQNAIVAGTQTYSIAGNIDLNDLPAGNDPVFGSIFGPNDVTTAHAWRTSNTALNARVTSFLELLATDPTNVQPPTPTPQGIWNGVVIREGADDRNVSASAEQEPVRTTVFDANDQPGQAQFLGELAPNEQSGDENRRLGFSVDGAISTRDDIDVYSFIAESNTEVWLDIDRTSNSLDTVIELIDINGNILASSNDSLAAERDVATGIFSSNRIDPDAAQALTVNELRVGTQLITINSGIASATSGNLTFGLEGSASTVNVSVADFNADPAGSIRLALNSGFSSQIGQVDTRLLARGSSDDFVIEVGFDEAFFVSAQPPNLTGTSNPVFPSIPALSIERSLPDAVLQDTY
ncbi:MAG: PPC domain-containing protein, partial [Planctomycetota bacterium]